MHHIAPMEREHNLHLHTPARTVAPEDSILIRPSQVEAWVSALPMTNLDETARHLFKTIVEFNRLDIPPPARIKVAELFRRPIGYIAESLRRYYFDEAFPLSAINRKAAVLSRELYSELALTYKIFIENLLANPSAKAHEKLLIIAIHRAIRSLLWVLYQSAIVYDPYPRKTWKDIHQLYAYAEKNQFHETPVKGDEPDGASSTISNIYLQALLFSISAPYHLRQREIEHVFLQLSAWSKRVKLSVPKYQIAPSGKNLFVAKLESDMPPTHVSLENEDIDSNCRLLDTGRLIETFEDHYDDLPSDSIHSDAITITGQAAKYLLRKLILALRSTHKRQFERTSLNLEFHNVVGLSTIHSILSIGKIEPIPAQELEKEEPIDSEMDWFESVDTRPLTNTQRHPLIGSENPELSSPDRKEQGTMILASDIDAPDFGNHFLPMSKEEKLDTLPETFTARTINECTGGYCIQWCGQNIPGIKVGEIFGIQSVFDSSQVSVGISRWIKNIPGIGLHVGIQMISLTSKAVTISLADMDLFSDVSQKCLLLPELEVADQPTTLILPALPFKTGDSVLVKYGSDDGRVQLTHLMEISTSFARFQFVEEDGATPKHILTEEEEERDFDSIWSDL